MSQRGIARSTVYALTGVLLASCALGGPPPASAPMASGTASTRPATTGVLFDLGSSRALCQAADWESGDAQSTNRLDAEFGEALARAAAKAAWAAARPLARQDTGSVARRGDPSTYYDYGQGGLAPAFHEASGVVFKPVSPEAGDAGAAGILRRLIAEHAAAQPPGWDRLVGRVKQALADGGEVAMAAAADDLVNEAPYIDNTGGVYFSPKRFYKRGGAVCKDFANVKYLLLRDAGFPVERMRIAALAPGAGGHYPEGHAVLVVSLDGAAEPYVLDLPNPWAFSKALAARKESTAQRVARLRAQGPEDAQPDASLGNMTPLSRFNMTPYGGARGLLMVSNEVGSRFFAMQRPALESYEELWAAADGSAKAVKGRDGVWVQAWAATGGGGYRLYRRIGEAQVERERLLAERSAKPGVQEKSRGQG